MRSKISIDTDYGVFYILYKSNVTPRTGGSRGWFPKSPKQQNAQSVTIRRTRTACSCCNWITGLLREGPLRVTAHWGVGARGGAVRALCYTLLPPIERRLDSSATCPSSFASTYRHVRVQPPATARRPRLQCRQQRRRPATARSRQADRYAPQDYLGVRCVPL